MDKIIKTISENGSFRAYVLDSTETVWTAQEKHQTQAGSLPWHSAHTDCQSNSRRLFCGQYGRPYGHLHQIQIEGIRNVNPPKTLRPSLFRWTIFQSSRSLDKGDP